MSRETWKQGYLERLPGPDGDVWWLRYRDGKKRPRERVGLVSDYPSKKAAERAARPVRDRINNPPMPVRLFGDLIAQYLAKKIPKRYSTQRGYRRMIRLYIEPRWGQTPIEKVKSMAVEEWLLGLKLAPKTRNHIHGLMKTLFRCAIHWEWYPQAVNPMKNFSVAGGSKRTRQPHILTPEQFEALLNEIPQEPYRTMVIVTMWLGLRCSELAGLKWEDIDFLGKEVHIRRGIVDGRMGETKNTSSEAKLPLDDRLAEVLKAYRAVAILRGSGDWVFAAPLCPEKPILPNNVVQRHVRPAGEAAKIPFPVGWHSLRHSYKAWMDRVGADSAIKRDLMRHADIRTTENVYGGAQMDLMRELNRKVIALTRIQ